MGDIRTTVNNATTMQIKKRFQYGSNNLLYYMYRQHFGRQRLPEIFDGRSHNAEPETRMPLMVTVYVEMVVKAGESATA